MKAFTTGLIITIIACIVGYTAGVLAVRAIEGLTDRLVGHHSHINEAD